MITMKKRIVALICCLAMVVAGLYVADSKQTAEAAVTTSGEMTLSGSLEGWNPKGFINISYTTTVTDYQSPGGHFLTEDFIDSYVTFGGGMTKADLMEGASYFYVATNSILQFNWGNRTNAFTPGWTFTLAEGTPLPYTNTSSGTSYMALAKEYTFTFTAGNESNVNIMQWVGYKTTTWSLAETAYFGNGNNGGTNLAMTDSNVANWATTKYCYIQNDSAYAEYINFNGVSLSNAAAAGLLIRYILDGATKCIQIESFGEFSAGGSTVSKMVAGEQFAFKKGMPIYYTGTDGNEWKATLDATYVYEMQGSNSDNALVFAGVKYDDTVNVYEYNTGTQESAAGYVNVGYTPTTIESATYGQDDLFKEKIAAEYFDLSGCNENINSLAKLSAIGAYLKFIPTASVSQLAFGDATKWQVGDTIILKKGMPVVWFASGNTLSYATLGADYAFEITSNNGTTVGFKSYQVGTYALSGGTSDVGGPENNYYYTNIYFESSVFSDNPTQGETRFDMTGLDFFNTYFYCSAKKASELTAEGSFFKYYNLTGNLMMRFYFPNSTWTAGDTIIIRKGLPISYTTSSSKAKTMTLDKDYGFVWDATQNKFVYDSTLVYEEEEEVVTDYATTINALELNGFEEGGNYKVNITATNSPTITGDSNYQAVSLLNNSATTAYVNIAGIDNTSLANAGVQALYIPTANVFQINFTSDYSWLKVGDEITFTEGMPIPVTVDGIAATATLQNTMTYKVTNVSTEEPYISMAAFVETKEFYLNGAEYDGIRVDQDVNYTVFDADGNQTILSDCKAGGAYASSALSYETMAAYMDFCGFTASELEAYGVVVQLCAGDGNQIMQIQVKNMPADMIAGELVTFKKGLPLTYTTTSGYKRTITLAKDYVFVVGAGIEADGVTYDCRWHYTETEPDIWRLKSGTVKSVGGSSTGGEGYFNNLDLGSSPLLDEQTSLNYYFTAAQMEKYIDFAGLSIADYGIQAIAIITSTDQVVQLRWGTASTAVTAGDTITFKAGLPILVSETVVYRLESDVVFTIEESSNGTNGFCLSNIMEVTKTEKGDADGDYILNRNDVNLIREALAEIVIADVDTQDATDDGVLNSQDLVRAKKGFDVEESEGNGTETYELILEKEHGTRNMALSNDDVKAQAQNTTYDINADLGTKNYIRLTYKTDTDLRGEIIYTVNGTEVTEEFFLESDEAQFELFLDLYRPNGLSGQAAGATIYLKQIILYNVSTTSATNVRLYKIEAATRDIVLDDMLWAENADLKVGVDLNQGGSLAWLECLKYTIYEFISDDDENIIATAEQYNEIGGDTPFATENVNLVNIYDLGRQIQQSYYSVPTSQVDWDGNTFAAGTCDQGDNWPYNPVQAGDVLDNQGQIIDYRTLDTDGDDKVDVIYTKVRAMDWSHPQTYTDAEGLKGKTTDSYMENWYRIEGSLLYVDNRFIDWSGYAYSVEDKTQELPAFYVGQGLNTLVSDKGGVQQKDTNLIGWTESGHYVNNTTTTDWYAFVNSEADDAFGVGIYIPGVEQTVAGRSKNHRSVAWYKFTDLNKNADEAPIKNLGHEYINKYQTSIYKNCFVQNTSYIAPVRSGWMRGYEDYAYSYVITADLLNNISGSFAAVQENNLIDNSSLQKWEIQGN